MARRKSSEVLAPQGLPLAALHINLADGEHPAHIAKMGSLARVNPVDMPAGLLTLHLPLMGFANGHHMMEDEGYLAAAGQADSWPLAPVLVRDLAGRVVHTGLNPLPKPSALPLMPDSCYYLPPTTPGYERLDKTFFTSFRRLEWAYGEGQPLTGRPKLHMQAMYPAPQLYPYKLRVDSFYQDGFRLPQVERLMVLPGEGAAASGADLMARWEARPAGQTYQQFYEANNGDNWFEQLFAAGCTVIPTLEATNGSYVVTADYGIADAWPGCVVEGLHEVLDYQADASPAGTILQVVRPGYALRDKVVPAQVVASDGSGYVSPLGDIPDPLQPDPRLPHPRVAACADVWLPTHPGHFELPTLWDWNADGQFQQVAGPLWDPVHYTYTSTARIVRAFRSTGGTCPDQAPVPTDMQPRFHPVCGLASYDTFASATQAMRLTQAGAGPLYQSVLDTVPLGRPVCGVGYHPLPAVLEYELDPFVFPALNPRNQKQEQPTDVAPVITSQITADEAMAMTRLPSEPARAALLKPEHFEGGYDLARYQAAELPASAAHLNWCYLPDLSTSELMINVKRFFMSKAYTAQLNDLHEALGKQYFLMREEALAWRRTRHRLARKYPGWYLWMWWFGHTPAQADTAQHGQPEYALLEAERLLKSQPGAF